MRSPYTYIADAILRRPFLVAGLIGAILLLSLVGASMTAMETGMSTYVDESTDRGMLLKKYTETFQSDSIMVLVETDDVLHPDVLSYMDEIETGFRTQRYVSEVSSVADLFRQVNGGTLPASQAEMLAAKEAIPPDVLSRIVPSPSLTIIVLELEPGVSMDAQFSLLDNMNAQIRVSEPPPGVQVTVTGEPAFSQQMMDEMSVSMGTLLLAAMLLMIVAMGLLFGHVRYRFLSVAIVAIGVLFTFGIMGLTGMKISMVVIGAFPVLIGIGIDYAIQFHSRFDEEVRHSSIPDAVRTTITKAGPSVLYAMIATSLGFMALWISPVPMIAGFGVVCVIGLVSCYLAALIIVPLTGVLLNYRPVNAAAGPNSPEKETLMERYNSLLGRLAHFVAKNPVPVILLCVLIAVVGFQADSKIIINTDEKTFVPSDMPAKIQLDKVTRAMGPTGGLPLYLRGEGVLTVDGINWMQEFQTYEETHNSKITGSRSIATYLIQYNGGELPGTQAELEEVLARIPEDTRNRYVNGNSEAIMEFSMVAMENNEAMSVIEDMQKHLEWVEPPIGITATFTGMGEMFTNLIKQIETGKLVMTLIAFALILAFLYLVYRRFGRAITPLVPIALIIGWNGLVMYVLGIDYTPMTATLGSMTIGVASEYTILIMERAYEEREKGQGLIPSIQRSVAQIGTAITVSGMTTVFGFAALILSAFNMISNFGAVTVITVGFTLIGAIVVMPGILSLVGAWEERRHAPSRTPSAE